MQQLYAEVAASELMAWKYMSQQIDRTWWNPLVSGIHMKRIYMG